MKSRARWVCHPVTLAREFRRHTAALLGQMVKARRIDFACRELVKRDALGGRDCDCCGLLRNSKSHFARTFKKLIGVTPLITGDNFRPR